MDKDNARLLCDVTCDKWKVGTPIQVKGYSLYYSYPYNRNFITASLVNVSSKVVKSLYLDIDCYDDANDFIGRTASLPITNVMAPAGGNFGSENELVIDYLNASRVEININKVVFADSTVWRAEGTESPRVPIPTQKKIEESENFEQILRECEGVTTPKFLPIFSDHIWLCTCGAVNENDSDFCLGCKSTKELCRRLADNDYLKRQKEEYEKEEREREIEQKYQSALVCDASFDSLILAAQRLEEIGAYKDAASLAAEYRKRAEELKKAEEEQKKELIYEKNIIKGKASYNEYLTAAKKLEEIGDYKDAATLAKEYKSEAASLRRNQQRQEKQKQTLKKKEEKLKAQRRKRAMRLTLIISSCAAAAALIVAAVIIFVIPSMTRRDNEDLYNEAMEHVRSGEFTAAVRILEKLGTYKNADKQIKAISTELTGHEDAYFLTSEDFPCYSISEDGVLSFDKTSYSVKTGVVKIPDVLDDIAVKSIESSFLMGADWVEKVIIPQNVKEISFQAFMNCTSLKEIEMHDGIISIGQSAFSGCTSLESVNIPEYVNMLGANAFYKCTSLKEIILPSRIIEIREHTFERCSSLTSVTFKGNVTSISSYAFSLCDSLEKITLPETLKEIGGNAFSQCTKLISIEIGSSVKTIGSRAFSGCTALTSVKLGEGVESLENYAFSDCTSLVEIELNSGIKNIKYKVFEGCTSLSRVLYKGSREEWENVIVGSDNSLLEEKLAFEN